MKELANCKIFFFGTSFFSEKILAHLTSQLQIELLVTMPDKPVGRKKIITAPSIKKWALKNNLPIKQFPKIDQSALSFFQKEKPDLIIVASYGLILPVKLLTIPRFGCINVHPSILPRHRGATPIQTTLLKGDNETGTTIMLMDETMDTGDILNQAKIPINPLDNFLTLQDKLISATNQITLPTLNNWVQGKIKPQKQKHAQATYTKLIKKNDGLIDWHQPAEIIFNQYRAYYQWPQIFSFWQNKRIILEEIALSDKNPVYPPGKIEQENGKIFVGTLTNSIQLVKIRPEGKKTMPIQDFTRGANNFIDSFLKNK